MPSSWVSWRRSLACKSQPGEVHDPQSLNPDSARAKVEAAVFDSRRVYMRSGCSRSIANLRDVIHSSRRIDGARVPALPNFSPKSVESNEFVQSISQETLLQEHGCDNHTHYKHPAHNEHSLQRKLISLDDIVANHHPNPHHHHPQQHHQHRNNGAVENITTSTGSGSFYGTPLHPSAHAYAHPATPLHHSRGSSLRKLSGCYDCKNPAVSLVVYKTSSITTAAVDARNGTHATVMQGSLPPPVAVPKAVCQRCGESFAKYEALEQHHLLKHAVAELDVGDSSRNVVEIIFRTSWLRQPELTTSASTSAGRQLRIERVLKVNNLARTLARFEDYREGVKMRASKLPKKHPRCLADGNELLRFYGARLECELLQAVVGAEQAGNCTLPATAACNSLTCSICKTIRTGFPKIRGPDGAANRGILTTATSGRAHQLMVADCGGKVEVDTSPSNEHRKTSASLCPQLAAREDVGACSSHQDRVLSRRTSGPDRKDGMMAMLVCRVIAGRVHKPPHAGSTTTPATPPHSGDLGPPCAGFDSVAGGELGANGSLPPLVGMGLHSRFEELTVFNPRAILPCFVVLYRC